ncbi:hypothetical protein CCP3SC15_1260005 [Gammaproteobacteria bacterium]
MNVNSFNLSAEIITALESSLSPERMATYVNATGGDKEKALRLYTWNTRQARLSTHRCKVSKSP